MRKRPQRRQLCILPIRRNLTPIIFKLPLLLPHKLAPLKPDTIPPANPHNLLQDPHTLSQLGLPHTLKHHNPKEEILPQRPPNRLCLRMLQHQDPGPHLRLACRFSDDREAGHDRLLLVGEGEAKRKEAEGPVQRLGREADQGARVLGAFLAFGVLSLPELVRLADLVEERGRERGAEEGGRARENSEEEELVGTLG